MTTAQQINAVGNKRTDAAQICSWEHISPARYVSLLMYFRLKAPHFHHLVYLSAVGGRMTNHGPTQQIMVVMTETEMPVSASFLDWLRVGQQVRMGLSIWYKPCDWTETGPSGRSLHLIRDPIEDKRDVKWTVTYSGVTVLKFQT